MRATTKYRAIEILAICGMWAALAFDIWHPGTRWPNVAMVGSLVVAIAARDPQRPRGVQNRWLGPVILLLMGGQLIVMAQPAAQTRTMLYAAAYIVAGVALWFWYRTWK